MGMITIMLLHGLYVITKVKHLKECLYYIMPSTYKIYLVMTIMMMITMIIMHIGI